jgi:hypothetical protein
MLSKILGIRNFQIEVKAAKDKEDELANAMVALLERVAFRMPGVLDHPNEIRPQDAWSADED